MSPALIGQTFPLGQEEREVFTTPATRADISDLQAPENRYEQGNGKLLEAYRRCGRRPGRPAVRDLFPLRRCDRAQRAALAWVRRYHREQHAGAGRAAAARAVALLDNSTRLRRSERRCCSRPWTPRPRSGGASPVHCTTAWSRISRPRRSPWPGPRNGPPRWGSPPGRRMRGAAARSAASIGGLRSLLVDIYPAEPGDGGTGGGTGGPRRDRACARYVGVGRHRPDTRIGRRRRAVGLPGDAGVPAQCGAPFRGNRRDGAPAGDERGCRARHRG